MHPDPLYDNNNNNKTIKRIEGKKEEWTMVSTVERGLTTDWAWAELEFRSAGKGRGKGRDGIG